MANTEGNICLICEKTLNEGNTAIVKERGIQTLIKSSEKRGLPQKVRLLKQRSSVSVHTECQKNFNNEKLIVAYQKKTTVLPPVAASTSRRCNLPIFNFHTHCFMCSKEIPEDFLHNEIKKPVLIRDTIYTVRDVGFKDSVYKTAEERGDEWGRQIIKCIEPVSDMVGARYHRSCSQRFNYRLTSGQKRGYRPANNVDKAMEYIFSYLEENSEECQFPLDDLVNQIPGEYRPDRRTVKSRLMRKYNEDIIIIEKNNQSPIVCFRDTGHKLLSDNWYKHKKSNPEEERLRVVKEAAAIIRADIRSQDYDMSEYPPSDRFLDDVKTVIPQSLQVLFREIIVKKKRGSVDKWNRICEALSHAVIAAVRPKSFLSSLLIGVSTYLYKKFGSKKLIDLLSSLGFAASYHETTLFEKSAIMRSDMAGTSVDPNSFTQIICDNADHNVNTIDGLNTVHVMGAIQCVTPHDALSPDQNIHRLSELPSAEVVGKFGCVPLSIFRKKETSGLKNVKIVDVEQKNLLTKDILPSGPDLLWLYGKWQNPELPGWNGFMEMATAEEPFTRSKIICLPFINFPPSQYDTIHTALRLAVDKCKISDQKTVFVTFDQPLYAKAQEIVANNPDFKNVVVRLGGFHLLMSFLGAIGYIMGGSGLKDLFSTIYAENSTEKMLAGHAYSRAVRAHILCHLALAHLVLESIEFTDDERDMMRQILDNVDKSTILRAEECESFKIVETKFKEALKKLEGNGPTAKLWIQYVEMVTLVKHFIEAERSGNWQLHLDTIQRMLPYFHASGHFLYAKSAHLYLQSMLDLEKEMDPIEYHKFTSLGYFTIRRSDKFWSGIWSDMTIEQTLMRMMHSCGGLTRGRGISDSVLTLWTLGMTSLHNVCDSIEDYCNVHLDTAEQHTDTRTSRISRDNQDLKKLLDWLSQHPPFPETDLLISISAGIVGNENINCHLSREKGIEGMTKMVHSFDNFESLKFKRKDKVLPLTAVNSSIKIDQETIPIEPLTLFQRMCISKKSDDEVKENLRYELAPYPLSLFSEDGMRKGTKSSLYAAFTQIQELDGGPDNTINVVDGGYLLHKVVWHVNDQFGVICERYIQYVLNHYGKTAIVVFDGYPADGANDNTKSAERFRRSKKQMSADIQFDEKMTAQVSQERFLANNHNKSRRISVLKLKMEYAGIEVKQAKDDADTLIVNTAISLCAPSKNVVVIGEDIDLLVLITALTPPQSNIYLLKPSRGKTAERLYSANSFKYKEASKNILFLHAFSGCDTTSSLFNQGKLKVCSLVEKNTTLNDIIDIYKDENAKPEEIVDAAVRFLVTLYGGNMEKESLEEIRYERFVKSSIKSKFNLASLPPTKDAVRYHAFRTYHQVQKWYGIKKEPEDWGWRYDTHGLTPITTTEQAAPDSLLNIISCKCKKGCSKSCSCRKAGLKCSIVCGFCSGQSCDNSIVIRLENDDNDDQESSSGYENVNDDDNVIIIEPGPSKRVKI